MKEAKKLIGKDVLSVVLKVKGENVLEIEY